MINPPVYSISLTNELAIPSKEFFLCLAESLNISDREAVVRFNDFAFDLKKKIVAGNEIVWNGSALLTMSNSGK